MQYIQGTPRNQLLVSSLEEKITTDNPVRFIETLLEVSCKSLKSFVDKPIMLKKLPKVPFNGLSLLAFQAQRKLSYCTQFLLL